MTPPLRALKWLSSETGSLRERTVRGGAWLLLGEAGGRVAGLAKVAILARLLSPADFGLLGVALLIQNWIGSLTQTGLSTALVQEKDDIAPCLNTVWTLQVIRGCAVAIALFLAAPWGARFFESPQAAPIIRLTGLLALLWDLGNPAVAYLRRELDFRKDVLWRASGILPGLVVGVGLAFWLRNATALVASLVSSRATEVVASYWVHPYRPRFAIEWRRARGLMRFGRWISVMNIVSFLERQLDSVVIAKLLGTASLGRYQVAQQIAMAPVAKLGSFAWVVLFSAFCKTEDLAHLRRGFLGAVRLLLAVVVPGAVFLGVFAEPLVGLALGSRWLEICPSLRILAWAGVAVAIDGVVAPVFLSSARPQWAAAVQITRLVLLTALVFPLSTSHGIQGVAVAAAAANMGVVLAELALAAKRLNVRPPDLARALGPALLGALPSLAWGLLVGSSSLWVAGAGMTLAGAATAAVAVRELRNEMHRASPNGTAGGAPEKWKTRAGRSEARIHE